MGDADPRTTRVREATHAPPQAATTPHHTLLHTRIHKRVVTVNSAHISNRVYKLLVCELRLPWTSFPVARHAGACVRGSAYVHLVCVLLVQPQWWHVR